MAVVHATADHAGRRLDLMVCQLMRVQDGKIVEVRGHYSDEAALDAFWGPASGRGADRGLPSQRAEAVGERIAPRGSDSGPRVR